MSVRGRCGRPEVVKQRKGADHQRLNTRIIDKFNPHPTTSYGNFRNKYLETLFANRAAKLTEVDSAEGILTDDVTGHARKQKSDGLFKRKILYRSSLHNATRTPSVTSTVKRPKSAGTSKHISTFYTYGKNYYGMPRPQLPLSPPDFIDDYTFCLNPNICDCHMNYAHLPEIDPDLQYPPPRTGSYNEPKMCEWCMREEERRRRNLMRSDSKYCSCGAGLQGMEYLPSTRPLSKWRPPSRFGPRPEKCCEPYIPYSHRHESKYHRHCKETEVRGQERWLVDEPWCVQPVRYRRTVPSQRVPPPPPCYSRLPTLRRSTVPSTACYR